MNPDADEPQPHPGLWPGAADLDAQVMKAHVTMQLSGRRPQSPEKLELIPDLGLKTYAVITLTNTGDVFEIGKGAYHEIRTRYIEPRKLLQSQMSKLVNNTPEVLQAKAQWDQYQELCRAAMSFEERKVYCPKVRESIQGYWESITVATNRLKLDTQSLYYRLKQKFDKLQARQDKYIRRLQKITSKFLASLGPGGSVLFATNLLESKKKTSKLDNGAISAMGFGGLWQQCMFDCKRTGCDLRDVREDRSSTWCRYCGRYNGNLGARRIFKCGNSRCLKQYPRDAGASSNIGVIDLMSRAKARVPRILGGLPQATVTEV